MDAPLSGKRILGGVTAILDYILDPSMIHELLLTLTETALGSHPRSSDAFA
jgi:hypothetical protein